MTSVELFEGDIQNSVVSILGKDNKIFLDSKFSLSFFRLS